MTKGYGQEILDAVVDDGIVTLEQQMYFLDAKRLAALTSMTYNMWTAWQNVLMKMQSLSFEKRLE